MRVTDPSESSGGGLFSGIACHYERYLRLSRTAVVNLQPNEPPPTREVVDDQTLAVVSFIEGIMLGFARGDRSVRDAAHLDRLLTAIVAGVSDCDRASNP
jgi:hypothetical protein